MPFPNPLLTALAQTVKSRREELSIAVSDLALMTGLTESTIGEIESGADNKHINKVTLRVLSIALRMPGLSIFNYNHAVETPQPIPSAAPLHLMGTP